MQHKKAITSSLYAKWINETNLQLKSKLADQIRDLPVRDGVECE